MKTSQIAQLFVDFFVKEGHLFYPSSSLIPNDNDQSVLFTNSGMFQFKSVFLGFETPPAPSVVTIQRCMRAGGKHNDLDNVGYTTRHHTFFQMCGNFSFGRYFKEEAILYAWNLLIKEMALPLERLWFTVYQTDDESYEFWKKLGAPESRIIRIGDTPGLAPYHSDNFWQMADTGPCGPCSEIFFDHGPNYSGEAPACGADTGERFVEIWNLVFMQFSRDASGVLHPLPVPCCDTGMGLERIAAVLQGVNSNYDIDIFKSLIAYSANLLDIKMGSLSKEHSSSLKAIADHVRASVFLLLDGLTPSVDGKGYVLRRILRRAIRHGYQLGAREPFLHQLVSHTLDVMSFIVPNPSEAEQKLDFLKKTILLEEERFASTLEQGMRVISDFLSTSQSQISGGLLFKLYDTYGFPPDLTADVCRQKGRTVDWQGFELEMKTQKDRARSARKTVANQHIEWDNSILPTQFVGYEQHQCCSKIEGILIDGHTRSDMIVGQKGVLILDTSPFYAEKGGQIGDSGTIHDRHSGMLFHVHNTLSDNRGVYLHEGVLESGSCILDQSVVATINSQRRNQISTHHSGTHLLHKALKTVLGDHVAQKGSFVSEDCIRFDFSHDAPLTPCQIKEIEAFLNGEIYANTPTSVKESTYDESQTLGAVALFSEKYGDFVRCVSIGSSIELCGGTHVEQTGSIARIVITSEMSVAAGVRRIEALAGKKALEFLGRVYDQQKMMQSTLQCSLEDLPSSVNSLLLKYSDLEKETSKWRQRVLQEWAERARLESSDTYGDHCLIMFHAEDCNADSLRILQGLLAKKVSSGIVVLSGQSDIQAIVLIHILGSVLDHIKARDYVPLIQENTGGRGGGRDHLVQIGRCDVSQWLSYRPVLKKMLQQQLLSLKKKL